MSGCQEPLEERLRRVLDHAARQLPVEVPDPRLVASSATRTGTSPRRPRGVGLWASGLRVAVTAIAVVVAVVIAIGALALMGHRHSHRGSVASGPNHGSAIVLAGSKSMLAARLRALRGRPIVLFVRSSWCEPCRADFGAMSAVARRYAGRVTFLGVDHDDSRAAARSLLRRKPLGFPSYRTQTHYGQAYLDLRPIVPVTLHGVPETVFINAKGQVASVHDGEYLSAAALVRDIDSHLLNS